MSRLPARRDDAGFSLIELLMVMILLGVMGSITTAGIASAMRTTRQGSAISHNNDALQTQLERITREIRVADPLRVATGNDLVVDVYRAGGCRRIEYRVSGTALQERILKWAAPAGCSAFPSVVTPTSDSGYLTLLTNVTSANPFTYLDHAGTALTAPATSAVAQVSVTFTQTQAELRAPLSVTGSASLRNAS